MDESELRRHPVSQKGRSRLLSPFPQRQCKWWTNIAHVFPLPILRHISFAHTALTSAFPTLNWHKCYCACFLLISTTRYPFPMCTIIIFNKFPASRPFFWYQTQRGPQYGITIKRKTEHLFIRLENVCEKFFNFVKIFFLFTQKVCVRLKIFRVSKTFPCV